jgi:HD domain
MNAKATHQTVTNVSGLDKTTQHGGPEEPFRGLPRPVQAYVVLVVSAYAVTAASLLAHTRPAVDAALIAIFALTALVRPVPNPLGGVSVPILGVVTTEALLWRPAEVLISVGVGAFIGLTMLRRSELWRSAINGAGWGLPAAASAVVAQWAIGGEPGLLPLGAGAVLAVAAYRVTNTAIFTMLRSLRSGGSFFSEWPRNIAARWTSQLFSAPLAVAAAAVASRLETVWAALGLTALSVAVLPIPRQELAYYHQSRQTLEEIVEAVVKALERVHPGSRAHGERVSHLAVETGRRLGMTPDALETLQLASRLHDVGLLARGDQAGTSHHAVVGSQCLSQFPDALIAEIVRAHHQRWDGRDAPVGHRTRMPLGARILAAAELYDSARWGLQPYRRSWSIDAAVTYLHALAGNVLDPRVVAVLLDVAIDQEGRAGAA